MVRWFTSTLKPLSMLLSVDGGCSMHAHVLPTHPSSEVLLEKATQTGHYDCILPAHAKCAEWPRNTATIWTTDTATPSVTISDTLTLHISKHTCILPPVLSQRHRHSTSQPAKAVAATLQRSPLHLRPQMHVLLPITRLYLLKTSPLLKAPPPPPVYSQYSWKSAQVFPGLSQYITIK